MGHMLTLMLQRLTVILCRSRVTQCLVIIGLMLSPGVLIAKENIQFKRLFSSEGGLGRESIGAVGAIVEDSKGFIWIGGEYGLARYDGHDLRIFKRDADDPLSLPRNLVRDLVIDRDGVMWVATSGGLAWFNPEQETFEPVELNRQVDNILISKDVSSLAVDHDNNLIIGTHIGLAIMDPQRQQIRKYRHDPLDGRSLSNDYIRKVYVDRNNYIWIGTSTGGLNRFQTDTSTFKRYLNRPGDETSLSDNDVRAILEDHKGTIWVGTLGGGISRLRSDNQTFKRYLHNPRVNQTIGDNAVHDLFEDQYQNVWVATDHAGLARYEATVDGFVHYSHSDYDEQSISSNHVRRIFEDSRGDLWVGNFPDGINFYDRSSSTFQNFSHKPDDDNSLSDSSILSFYKDSRGTLWIGTENGLNIFDEKSKEFTRIYHDSDDADALRYGTVLAINEDLDGALWIGTWSGGLHRFDHLTGKFKNYFPSVSQSGAISSNLIWDVLIDKKGDLWVATEKGGLNLYNRSSDTFTVFRSDQSNDKSLINDNIWTMLEDQRGNFWLGTFGGLELFDRKARVFTHFQPDPSDPNSISGIRVMALIEDSEGKLWISTQDGGLNVYLPDEKRFIHIGVEQGLPANELSTLVEDDYGHVWVGSTGGIARVDKQTHAVTVYTKDHGLVGNNFNRDASYKDEQGNIYIGGVEGFSIFHPEQLNAKLDAAPVYITGMSIMNSYLTPRDKKSKISATILATDSITLDYRDSVFTFDFALLSYRSSYQNQYAYKLEGFDRNWNYVGKRNNATYTSMDPGRYVFKVKAANRDGVWSTHADEMEVIVLPPPWQSWWAYLIYGSALLIFMLAIWTSQQKRLQLVRERKLNNQLIKIDQMKDAILANTSHELRTPLNSIIGIVESLCDGVAGELGQAVKDYLHIVLNSGRRLNALVDNILEYANLSTSPDALARRSVDLHFTVQSICHAFAPGAKAKNIKLLNLVPRTVSVIQADELRLQQVITGLIDNAVKFTEQGSIEILCDEHDDSVKLTVVDTGCGIDDRRILDIFDSFNAAGDSDGRESAGAGLGLPIAKHLVEQHGGYMGVETKVGFGSKFFIVLPKDNSVILTPSAAEKSSTISGDEASQKRFTLDDIVAQIKSPADYTILIVDDDSVNRMVLTVLLSQFQFVTVEVSSGFEALEVLKENRQIDLVILDVMMPGLSGFTTCKKIRESFTYWELPIIFLTAKKIHGSCLEGFASGGNDFVTKPISKIEFIPRLVSQLKLSEAVRRSVFRR